MERGRAAGDWSASLGIWGQVLFEGEALNPTRSGCGASNRSARWVSSFLLQWARVMARGKNDLRRAGHSSSGCPCHGRRCKPGTRHEPPCVTREARSQERTATPGLVALCTARCMGLSCGVDFHTRGVLFVLSRLFFVRQETMREADTDSDGVVSFAELVSLMHKLKKDPNASSLFVRKIHKAPAQVRQKRGGLARGLGLHAPLTVVGGAESVQHGLPCRA